MIYVRVNLRWCILVLTAAMKLAWWLPLCSSAHVSAEFDSLRVFQKSRLEQHIRSVTNARCLFGRSVLPRDVHCVQFSTSLSLCLAFIAITMIMLAAYRIGKGNPTGRSHSSPGRWRGSVRWISGYKAAWSIVNLHFVTSQCQSFLLNWLTL